jgi:hypothetical protein
MFVAGTVFWFFMIPVNSLGTALALGQLRYPERSFGFVRVWGTVGWAAAGVLLSVWLHALKPWAIGAGLRGSESAGRPDLADSFTLAMVFALVLAGYSLTLPHTPPSPVSGPAASRWLGLRRLIDAPLASLGLLCRPAFLTYGVCLFGFYLTMSFSTQLVPLLLERDGVGRDVLPMAMTLCQTTEVATLVALP